MIAGMWISKVGLLYKSNGKRDVGLDQGNA